MPAWIFAQLSRVMDPEVFAEYRNLAGPTMEQYGGKFVGGGMVTELVEGDWSPLGIAAAEFPNMEQLKSWYNSPEYQAVIGKRQSSTESGIVFVDGG